MACFFSNQRGFSLVWASVAVAVAGIALVSTVPGGQLGNEGEKNALTLQRMQKIEEATKSFMAKNLRRPCPASGTYRQDSQYFGVEAATNGKCTGGTPAADFSAGSTVVGAVAGTVPTKTLNLPDEYGLDGYGRRIMYVVDRDATQTQTCHDLQSSGRKGAIRILSSYSTTTTYDNVMWALVSYGKDGQGAFPEQGSSMANRMESGNSHTDTAINAFAAAGSMGSSTFTGTLVKRDPSVTMGTAANFDDMVWYLDYTKNLCALGKAAHNGFRIAGTDTGRAYTDTGANTAVNTGDINGDGIPDLVILQAHIRYLYVIFGSPIGWPQGGLATATPLNLANITGTTATITGISRANPGVVTSTLNPGNGNEVYIVNVTGMTEVNNKCYKAASSGAASFALQDVNTNNVVTTNYTAWSSGGYAMRGCGARIRLPSTYYFGFGLAVGDVTNDGYDDIAITGVTTAAGASRLYLLFGSANFTSADFSASVPVYNGSPVAGISLDAGTTASNTVPNVAAIGNINGDAYKDVLFADMANSVRVVFGNTIANLGGIQGMNISSNASFTMTYGFRIYDSTGTAPSNGSYPFVQLPNISGIERIAIGDVNSDGIEDMAFEGRDYNAVSGAVWLVFGRYFTTSDMVTYCTGANPPPCKFDLSTQFTSATMGVRFSTVDAANSLGNNVRMVDINRDGIKDLVTTSVNKVYGYYGRTSGWATNTAIKTSNSFSIDTSSPPLGIVGGPTYLTVGDVNSDSLPDLLLGYMAADPGANQGYSSTRTDAGSIFVIMQPVTGFSTSAYTLFGTGATNLFHSTTADPNYTDGTYGFRVDGASSTAYAFTSVVTDLNKDGKQDIIIPAGGDGSAAAYGPTYVLYGRTTVPWDRSYDLGTMQ